jgi:hypothetical protein
MGPVVAVVAAVAADTRKDFRSGLAVAPRTPPKPIGWLKAGAGAAPPESKTRLGWSQEPVRTSKPPKSIEEPEQHSPKPQTGLERHHHSQCQPWSLSAPKAEWRQQQQEHYHQRKILRVLLEQLKYCAGAVADPPKAPPPPPPAGAGAQN